MTGLVDRIVLPTKLDPLAALRVGAAITASAKRNGAVAISIPPGMTAEPFGMLYLANLTRASKASGVAFEVEHADPHSYIAHMGLLGEFDARFKRGEDEVSGENERYIAIREVTRSHLNDLANEQRVANVGEIIELEGRKFAEVLTQNVSNEIVFALTYCLREIVRNAYEHSGAAELLVCAQYRPSAGRVDLAFADRGVGILRTLKRNRRVTVADEADAIKVALLPGISGAPKVAGMEDDPWRNTGYGLYMTQRICREGGAFLMTSNNAFLRYAGGRKIERSAVGLGTIVGLTLQLDALQTLNRNRLGIFHAQGAEIAKTLRGANVTASTASVTLRMTE